MDKTDKPKFETLPADEWLSRHNSPNYVSASMVPSILGMNKWCSAFTLHQRLTGHLPLDNRDKFAMRLGHHMEPFLAEEYSRETGHHVEDPGDTAIVSHPDLPWFYATLDRIALNRYWGAIELKTTKVFTEAAKDWRTSEPPLAVQAQIQAQLLLSGLTWGALVGCILGQDGIINARVTPHARFQEIILSAVQEFKWRLDNDRAPAIDGSDSTSEAVKEIAGVATADEVVADPEIHETAAEVLAELFEAKQNEAAWKDKRQTCENRFTDWIGNHAGMQFGSFVVKRPNVTRAPSITIPLKGLPPEEVDVIQRDIEELALDYKLTPASTYRRFYWPKEGS